MALQVDARELRVVVEHLLEVRHQPALVHRVAVEAAADLVVHAAARHHLEGARGHAERLLVPEAAMGAQEQGDAGGRGELGGAAESTPARVEVTRELGHRLADLFRAHGKAGQRPRVLAQEPGDLGRLRAEPSAVALPEIRDAREQGLEPGTAVAVHGWKVRAREEGLLLRGEEDGHRPAALAVVHGQGGRHVDVVEIRPLFAVHLHGHEVLVHEPRDLLVLEGLTLHDVAPVAGRVSDTQEDRLVLRPGPRQGIFAPGVPVYGIVGVLEEVGTGRFDQSVGVGVGGRTFVHENTVAHPTKAIFRSEMEGTT